MSLKEVDSLGAIYRHPCFFPIVVNNEIIQTFRLGNGKTLGYGSVLVCADGPEAEFYSARLGSCLRRWPRSRILFSNMKAE
jgi:hypothetical protein